jgi:hypothetical protein
MTPTEELRTAATRLRDIAPEITGHLAGLADPVAAWLDLEADVIAAREADFPGGEWAVDLGGDCALAVAHAVLGGAR